jgi:tRNA 5-methylaminomethyl-2-thiouridine biosynthesis bifunctional protein
MTQNGSESGPGALVTARLEWRDGAPRSTAFGDVYFSAEDGAGETRHVFLDGIGAPEIWRGRTRFTIGELGFGTGLNVLTVWDSWRRTAAAEARLHIVSVEGFPLSAEDLAAAHERFPEFADLSAALRRVYPRRVPGFHRLRLDGGRVALTLLFGDVGDMLARLDGRVDAWFLDGFAPSRNPDMWSAAVFREIARLSAAGARVATFSAAGAVRRGLGEVGFEMEKRPGHGSKRESLAGRFTGAAPADAADPWYAPPASLDLGSTVAVVGGGIAGRAAVRELSDEGFRPILFDAGEDGSQPERVLVSPRLADPADAYGRFMAQAFVHADRQAALPPPAGALHLPKQGELERLADFIGRLGWGDGLARSVDARAASELAGLPTERGGIWFPQARFARPAGVTPAEVRTARVTGLSQIDGAWSLALDDGSRPAFDAVVLTAGPWSAGLVPGGGLDLRANRGQLCFLPPTKQSQRLRLPVSFGGHVTPLTGTPGGAMHVVGSSYRRWDLSGDKAGWVAASGDDMRASLAGLADVFPVLADAWQSAPLTAWAGLRATTADHLPLVGPLADAAAYAEAYGGLHHGRRGDWPAAPYLRNGFILSGLGSRGYQTAFLAAEVLASRMAGMPLPVEREIADALHPARMLIRQLRRPPGQRDT